jgi:hypothetical protein
MVLASNGGVGRALLDGQHTTLQMAYCASVWIDIDHASGAGGCFLDYRAAYN